MAHRTIFRFALSAALALYSVAFHAQSPPEPTAYTVTMQFQVTGAAVRTTYRLGSKVLVDSVPSPGIPASPAPAIPTRTLYLLDTGQSVSWEPANPSAGCQRGTFQGDAWQDPFSGAADFALPGVTQSGTEILQGIAARILVSKAKPGFRLWVDPKTGLMLKAEYTPPSTNKAIPYFEVTEVHLEAPPAALFQIPAHCAPEPEKSKSKSD